MTPREARNAYRRQYRKNMTPDQRKHEKEYNQKWRRNHPEAVKAAQVRYWAKKAAEIVSQGTGAADAPCHSD